MRPYTALTIIVAVAYIAMLVADLRIGNMSDWDRRNYTIAANALMIVWILVSLAKVSDK